jgi:hypothetical protein
MKILIALAAGMLATGALAQSTMTTTTNTMAPSMMNHSTMDHHKMTTSMHHSETRMSGDRDHMMMRHHHHRKCYMQMRHGHSVRVCRTRHNMM